MRLLKQDAPQRALAVSGAAGSFAAVSTLVGNPLVAAFLLLEVAGGGMGGALLGPLLMPGLLAAGIGTLVFVGLDSWTGFGTLAGDSRRSRPSRRRRWRSSRGPSPSASPQRWSER